MASSTRSAGEPPAIVWFRDDLRLSDNPALTEAAASGAPLVALYMLDEAAMGDWRPGAASRWWLHHSLSSLAADLAARGVPLVLRRGAAEIALPALIAETGAGAVYWNRLYEPWAVRRDGEIKARLRAEGVKAESFNASLLFEPTAVRNGQGEPFRVFTPFWRACLARPEPAAPLPAPARLRGAPAPASERLEDWRLLPTKPDWAGGLREAWKPGERAAQAKLAGFRRERRRAIRRSAQRSERGWRFATLAASAFRRNLAAPGLERHRHSGGRSRRAFSAPARMARILPPSAFRQSGPAREPARQKLRALSLARGRQRPKRLEKRTNRLSARRRRDARALAHGLYA